jgi:hypothetical protein
VAIAGYARQPDFEVHPPNAISTEERIAYALLHRKVFRDACEKENIDLRIAKRMVESGMKRELQRERREKEQAQRKRGIAASYDLVLFGSHSQVLTTLYAIDRFYRLNHSSGWL